VAFQGRHRVGSGSGKWYDAIDGTVKVEPAVQPFLVQAIESAQETKRPRSVTSRPLCGRKRTCADTTVSSRRRKPHPNLSRVCVSADRPTKMRWIAGLGFSRPRSKNGPNQTSADRLRWVIGDALSCICFKVSKKINGKKSRYAHPLWTLHL
jgi:hypothetical protein